MNIQSLTEVSPVLALRERLVQAIGTARRIRKAGNLECYVRPCEPGGMYVLDTSTGIVFHEPMEQKRVALGEWMLPGDARLLARHMRLMCSMDDPLTIEDAYALMGEEIEAMVAGISSDPELFDLTVPGGGLPLLELAEHAVIVKHPRLPVFAVGMGPLAALAGGERTSLALVP
ncbi:hypothetical protein H8Z72_23495 (plasmid) [Xanthomonas citri pv. citri]|uniref:hypothetical protein n=1 Tax=Xanthomonas citri TaxID=346 RepID=UPI00193338C6|nr:hypothetical protein [Xanthomonas citri]QRD62720.1 hypothetical protein H8Z74_22690 [Xanthomonas citri pv. citri]QRD67047.1 hypothetical protein H8Z73_22775 [Xanthomonas citri pv. citri]QRD71700.1 hypothetical protein H8Z72_23495 [Xanthomonas citri pv. citri]